MNMKAWLALPTLLAGRLLAVLLLAFLALGASPAAAKIMRFVQEGETALVFHMPDDWTTNIDIATQAETLVSPGNNGLISLSILADRRPLEGVAAQVLRAATAGPSNSARALSVSTKEAYAIKAQRAGNGSLTLSLLVIRVDPDHIAVCLALVPVGSTPAQVAAAEGILDTIRVSPPDNSFGG
jgi:hypothetical protein